MSSYDEHEPHTMVTAQVLETLQWCLQFFVKRDESNGAVHLSITRYSPLTESVAEALHTLMEYQPLNYWPPGAREMVERVLSYQAVFDSPPPHGQR
jgi:hypothetical protein